MKEKLYDVYFTKENCEKKCKVTYCCASKQEAERLFYSERQDGEKLIQIVKVKKAERKYHD